MDDEELIEKFLKAQMTKSEENKFLDKIRTEPIFKTKVLVKTLLIQAIRNVGRRIDQEIIQSVTEKLTWKKYTLIYGVYVNYYFTDNMPRYKSIFNQNNIYSVL